MRSIRIFERVANGINCASLLMMHFHFTQKQLMKDSPWSLSSAGLGPVDERASQISKICACTRTCGAKTLNSLRVES